MNPHLGTTHLAELVRAQLDPEQPIVRAALDHAVKAWLSLTGTDAEIARWGLFATAVQAVTAAIYGGPAALIVDDAGGGDAHAIAALVHAAADVFARAARLPLPRAWEYAAAAAQLRDAADYLRQGADEHR
jgi:hypothetical protein